MDEIQDAPAFFTLTSAVSLLAVLILLGIAYSASVRYLPKNATTTIRVLAIWHLFDVLIHTFLEGSYLYSCFAISLPISAISTFPKHQQDAMTPPGVFFMSKAEHLYGAFYGTSLPALLWQEYAKADRRWGGSDLTVISLELLTVFVMGPLALYVFTLLARGRNREAWFWAAVIATGEIYGGWMTFCPEWLSGSPNLTTENWLYLWVYLALMNSLWVWIPMWILYNAYFVLVASDSNSAPLAKKTR